MGEVLARCLSYLVKQIFLSLFNDIFPEPLYPSLFSSIFNVTLCKGR